MCNLFDGVDYLGLCVALLVDGYGRDDDDDVDDVDDDDDGDDDDNDDDNNNADDDDDDYMMLLQMFYANSLHKIFFFAVITLWNKSWS